MTSYNVHRVRATLVLANLTVVAGFVSVLPLVLQSFLPAAAAAPLLALVPELPAGLAPIARIPWLPSGLAMPILIALAGLVAMLIGSSIASRQRLILDALRRFREDSQRRAHFYRVDARLEPTFGSPANEKQAA